MEYFNDQTAHPGVFRTTSPFTNIRVYVLQLLQRLGWTYVHVLHIDNTVNAQLAKDMGTDARNIGICFASINPINLLNLTESIDDALGAMLSVPGAVGVVVLLPEPSIRTLFHRATLKKTGGKLVFVVAWDIHRMEDYVVGNEEAALG